MKRIVIAKYGQETSSFSNVSTTLDTFRMFGLYEGAEILDRWDGVGSMGGFLSAVKEYPFDVSLIPIISGWAGANGVITASTLAFFEEKLLTGLRSAGEIDGIFFDLHGAGQAENAPDSEGYLLQKIRELVGPDIPIVASFDHHANITQAMVDVLDGLVGHRDQPHRPLETGRLAGDMLGRILSNEIRPAMAWKRIPMLTHQEQYLTTVPGPMMEWFNLARDIESRPGVLSASTFPVQPWLDVPECGWAAVVVTDNDPALAGELATELAEAAWQRRDRFWKLESVPVAEAVRRAIEADSGLVVLSDTGDSVFGGATGDSTHVLQELLRQQPLELALLPMVDAEVVEAAREVGVGGRFSGLIGGKLDIRFSQPISIDARVAKLGGGRIDTEIVGMGSFDMGDSALLEVGNIRIVVSTERAIGGNHPIVYRHFGLEPAEAKMVLVKTASNWQYFEDMTSEVIRVNSPGATTSDLHSFEWEHLSRPMYPFDPMDDWR
jgi:microcystin degradation protein MlrC